MKTPNHPQLIPVDICERVIDFVANEPRNLPPDDRGTLPRSRYYDCPSLANCALVCRAWLPRSRFYLGKCISDIGSRQGLESLCLFLSASPHLATTLHSLYIYGGAHRNEPIDDSWVSSVPMLLPTLSSGLSLHLTNIDLSHQHVTLYSTYNFKFANTESLHLLDVSFKHFSQVTRLAHAVHAKHVQLNYCLLPTLDGTVSQDRRLLLNPWLKTLSIDFSSWTDLDRAPLHCTILACPNLSILSVDTTRTLPGTLEMRTLRSKEDWYRICAVARYLFLRSVQPGHRVRMYVVAQEVTVYFPGFLSPALILSPCTSTGREPTTAALIATWSCVLLLLSPCPIPDITIDHTDATWSWDDHSPEIWRVLDETLLLYRPSLHRVDVQLPNSLTYHDVLTPQYGCVDNLIRALLPKMTAAGVLERKCNGQTCFFHQSQEIPLASETSITAISVSVES